MSRLPRLFSVLGLALGLAACGHVPVSTLYQLRKFDPVTFDPEPVRIAVRISDAVEPRKDGTVFEIVLHLAGQTPEKVEHRFILERMPSESEPALREFAKAGQAIHVFRFTPADAARVRELQARIREARGRSAGRNQAEIRVGSKACRKRDLPAGPLASTTLIRTAADGPFLVLVNELDLRVEVPRHGGNLETDIPPCD